MKPLPEQPPRMRRRAIIMHRKRPVDLTRRTDMAEIAPLRGITGERPTLQRQFLGGRVDHAFAAALVGKATGADLPTGKIIGGEFIDRQTSAKPRGQSIRRVVILVAAFEGRDPYRLGVTGGDGAFNLRHSRVEMMAQPARRAIDKTDRLKPDQRRGGPSLVMAAAQPFRISRPLPRPQRLPRRCPGRQIQHEDPGTGHPGAHGGDAAGDDLIIGMRRHDQDPARFHQAAARAAAICHTGSRSSINTSTQSGTWVST